MIELPWLAGWIEARGSIHARAREVPSSRGPGRWRQDHVQVAIPGPVPLLEAIVRDFGGYIDFRKNAKHTARWRSGGVPAETLLRVILPYVKVRRLEIEAALTMRSTIQSVGRKAVDGLRAKKREDAARAVSELRRRTAGEL